MADVEFLSKKDYQWGHFGVILYHLLLGITITYFVMKLRSVQTIQGVSVNTVFSQKPLKINLILTILLWLGVTFIIISALSFIPIFNDKDYVIS